MWETIKNALMGVKEATGFEIPGLPEDLSSLGDSATTAVQDVTESATGFMDGAAATATEAIGGDVTGLGEAAGSAVDSATQGLPEIPDVQAATEALK